MPRFVSITALAVALRLVTAQLETIDQCGQNCVNSMVAKFGALNCQTDSASCLCANPDFGYGARDCAIQAPCGDAAVAQVTQYISTLCATATLATVQTQSTAPVPASSLPPAPTPSTTTLDRTVQTAPQSASTTETQHSETSSTPSTPSTSTSSAKPTPPSPSTGSAGSKSPSDDASSGLSTGAKVGIGVGAAAVALMIGAVGFCLLARRSPPNVDQSQLHISGPMPGSGRDFGSENGGYSEKNKSDLEMRSRRYEDMLPRRQPNWVI